MTVTANDTTSGISQYCYSTNASGEGTCQNNGSISLTKLQAGTEYTYYIYTKDKAGNSGISSKYNYAFKTKSNNPLDYLRKYEKNSKGVKTLQDVTVNGLYRYYGNYDVVDNNYICLGPSGNTCKSNDDKNNYMYRIIGIADGSEKGALDIDKGQIKVIKSISIGDKQWHISNTNIDWEGASLQTYLNGESTDKFYGSLDERIISKIKEVKWYIGDYHEGDYNNPPPTSEKTDKTSSLHRIGIMYASDYYQSWGEYENENTDSWLNICHGLSSGSPKCGEKEEWTMTRYGLGGKYYSAWYVSPLGSLFTYGNYDVSDSLAVRPVFYLIPNITLTGEGTESNPFIINS